MPAGIFTPRVSTLPPAGHTDVGLAAGDRRDKGNRYIVRQVVPAPLPPGSRAAGAGTGAAELGEEVAEIHAGGGTPAGAATGTAAEPLAEKLGKVDVSNPGPPKPGPAPACHDAPPPGPPWPKVSKELPYRSYNSRFLGSLRTSKAAWTF